MASASKNTSLTDNTSSADLKQEDEMESNADHQPATQLENVENNKEVNDITQKDGVVVEEHQEDEDADYPHGAKLVIILAALCLAVFLVALDNTIISTASKHFSLSQKTVLLRVGIPCQWKSGLRQYYAQKIYTNYS